MTNQLLMTPGPSLVPQRILDAMSKPVIHHRTVEFNKLVESCTNGVKEVFQTKNDLYILTSSGTGAMEAAISNVIHPGEKVLAIVNGKFSERLAEIALAYGANLKVIDVPWGEAVNLKIVKENLTPDTRAVLVVHNETSTGVRNDIEAIGRLTKGTETLLIIDTISSMSGDDIQVDDWAIDLCISGSQKCFSLPPGISFISISEKAWKLIDSRKYFTYYFDLRKYRDKYPKPPFTPAISMFYGLEESLKIIKEEGLQERFKRHHENAIYCREKVKELGFELFPKTESIASNTLTSVKFDKANELRKRLSEEYNILIAGAQNEWKGKMFRIGHMGVIGKEEIDKTILAIKKVMVDL